MGLFVNFESSRPIKEILYKIKLIKKFYKDFKYWIIQGKFLRSLMCKKKKEKNENPKLIKFYGKTFVEEIYYFEKKNS